MRKESNNNLRALIWWIGYIIAAIWAQKLLPGVDFLVPGLVVAMQERPGGRAFLLGLVFILLQEGMGGLSFGYGIAWYGSLLVLFQFGRWLFDVRSFLFMCLLGLAMGALHPLLTVGLMSLESLRPPMDRLLVEGALQALIFPAAWWLTAQIFPEGLKVDDSPY